jgi:hypothetical protein
MPCSLSGTKSSLLEKVNNLGRIIFQFVHKANGQHVRKGFMRIMIESLPRERGTSLQLNFVG